MKISEFKKLMGNIAHKFTDRGINLLYKESKYKTECKSNDAQCVNEFISLYKEFKTP